MLPIGAFGQRPAKDLFIPEANVQNAITYVDRGKAKQKKSDLNGAMADYNQAIQLNPKYAAAYDNWGNIKQKKGDLNGAIADYDDAITLNPKYAAAYNNRGDVERKKLPCNPHFAHQYVQRGVLVAKAPEDIHCCLQCLPRFKFFCSSNKPLRSVRLV